MKRGKRLKHVVIGLCAGAVVLVSALVAAWAGGLILHDSSRPVAVRQAIAEFRAGKYADRGTNGVYLYATRGRESIDALGGASHTYPTTTTITVVEVPCGLDLHWAALSGRSTTWTFCRAAPGIALVSSNERHSFFGEHDHTVYSCASRVLIPADSGGRLAFPFRCTTKSAWEIGDMKVLGRGAIPVGNEHVPAIHVRSTLTIHGGNSGAETIDWWLDTANSLPLRVVLHSRTARSIFVGTVHYREDLVLRLLSLTPKR